MRYRDLIYEGDGIVRGPVSVQDVERHARKLRALSIGTLIESLFDWLERRAHESWQRQAEAYLAQASDLADLERRMRRLERRPELFG